MQLVPLSPGGRVVAVATAPVPPGPLQVALRVSGEARRDRGARPARADPGGSSVRGGLRGLPARARPARRPRAHGHLPGPRGPHRRRRDPHAASRPARHLRAARSALRRAGRPSAADTARHRAYGPARRGRSGGPLSCPRRPAPTPSRARVRRPHRPGRGTRCSARGRPQRAADPRCRPAHPPGSGSPTTPPPAHPQPAAPGALGDHGPRRRAAARVADAGQHAPPRPTPPRRRLRSPAAPTAPRGARTRGPEIASTSVLMTFVNNAPSAATRRRPDRPVHIGVPHAVRPFAHRRELPTGLVLLAAERTVTVTREEHHQDALVRTHRTSRRRAAALHDRLGKARWSGRGGGHARRAAGRAS